MHRADSCTVDPVTETTRRINVTLDPVYAAKLARMAEVFMCISKRGSSCNRDHPGRPLVARGSCRQLT
jgi:hypothetical protein